MEAIRSMRIPDILIFFKSDPGTEHYKLLAYLSILYTNVEIFDIGTNFGYSAFALAFANTTNTVLSFDIEKVGSPPILDNVSYYFDNLMEESGRQIWKERLLRSPLIMLDISPHEGSLEYKFYLWLRHNNYQGIMICDDITHFDDMRNNFWDKVAPEHKLDITRFGHWSGTGVIFFNSAAVPEFMRTPH
jgi:hypothetical protein